MKTFEVKVDGFTVVLREPNTLIRGAILDSFSRYEMDPGNKLAAGVPLRMMVRAMLVSITSEVGDFRFGRTELGLPTEKAVEDLFSRLGPSGNKLATVAFDCVGGNPPAIFKDMDGNPLEGVEFIAEHASIDDYPTAH